MIKYKVTNKLECTLKLGDLIFEPKETKVLDFKPKSDRFNIEELEQNEKKQKVKGGNKK